MQKMWENKAGTRRVTVRAPAIFLYTLYIAACMTLTIPLYRNEIADIVSIASTFNIVSVKMTLETTSTGEAESSGLRHDAHNCDT